MKTVRIIFFEPYPIEGPSSRYRVEQYIGFFRKGGIICRVRPFVSSKFYGILYKKGLYLKKILFFLQGSLKRLFDFAAALNSDIIFIHLEAFPLGPPIFEWGLAFLGKKIIFDFDDAIYIGKSSPANVFMKFLKCPSKIKTIIKISRHVIVCNEYLADYARKYNKNVSVIHTCVDAAKFFPKNATCASDLTIGWVGTHTTAGYLDALKDVFADLSKKYSFNLKIIGAGPFTIKLETNNIHVFYVDWQLKNEVEYFQSLDIGIYPLPDNEWAYGKGGFKAIQYMSVGVPCVASRVGINRTIVKDGVNGYLATTKSEWTQKLSMLIEDPLLRRRIGSSGRKTVEERFSLQVNAPRYMEIIQAVLK